MTCGTAFYAPMKPPDDPVPSGDRTIARALMRALDAPEIAAAFGAAELVSRLKTRDGKGSAETQATLEAAAATERARLAPATPALWLTYHCYYKAPDLLGPAAADRGALYAIVEPSRSAKRLEGPWARFARAAEEAISRADALFYMTERDRPALDAELREGQVLTRLRPFLGEPIPDAPAPRDDRGADAPIELLAVGMMRPGDKAASYAALAAALALAQRPWRLTIVGDGPARAEVEALFAGFEPGRVRYRGALDVDALRAAYRAADLLVWPGVNEAYGLVYLEAQAQGLPVLAEDRPGVSDVAREGAYRTRPGEPWHYAATIDAFAADRGYLREVGASGWEQMRRDHSLESARKTLLDGLLEARERRERRRRG